MSSPTSATTVVVQQPGPIGRFFSKLGWILFGFTALLFLGTMCGMVGNRIEYYNTTGNITEKYVSGDKFGTDKVAIISIEGVIMNGHGYVKNQIDRVREDENVKAVVVRVDSPGGTVTGSDYMLHHLNKLREEKGIPIVVSMGSVAASGGYYVSMAVGDQEKSIYAEPTTTTGSIGVIVPHYDLSGLLARFDVKDDSIATHPRKEMLSMTKPLSDDNRKLVEEYINEAFTRFKDIIVKGRPKLPREKLDELATGEIFSGPKAQSLGLVDEIGFLEDAVKRAIELAGLTESDTRVVKYGRNVSLLDLAGGTDAEAASQPLGVLLELSSPRAYFLSSTLPTLINTHRAD